jgi:preprotein translocase subunit SecG
MLAFFTTVHVLLCIFMILVILLQPGKDAGMGAALGGGAATSAFGGRGAVTFLSKVTAACAVAFFITSLGLSLVGLKTSKVTNSPLVAKQHADADAEKAKADEAAKANAPAAEPAKVEQGDPTRAPSPTPAPEGLKATDAVPADKVP